MVGSPTFVYEVGTVVVDDVSFHIYLKIDGTTARVSVNDAGYPFSS